MARDRILQIYRGTTAQNDAFTGAQGELTMDTARKEIRIHDGSTAGGNVIGLTPGFIAPFAGSTAPAGWLVCDGSAVSRTTYAKLFAVIGTTYGAGDGNSTFNLPDSNKKIPLYDSTATLGATTNGKAPNIKGEISNWANYGAAYNESALYGGSRTNWGALSGSSQQHDNNMFFDASRYNSVYDDNATGIIPAGVYMLWCIKY